MWSTYCCPKCSHRLPNTPTTFSEAESNLIIRVYWESHLAWDKTRRVTIDGSHQVELIRYLYAYPSRVPHQCRVLIVELLIYLITNLDMVRTDSVGGCSSSSVTFTLEVA